MIHFNTTATSTAMEIHSMLISSLNMISELGSQHSFELGSQYNYELGSQCNYELVSQYNYEF